MTSHGAGRRLIVHERVDVGVEFGVEEGGMWENGRAAQGGFKRGVGIVAHEKVGASCLSQGQLTPWSEARIVYGGVERLRWCGGSYWRSRPAFDVAAVWGLDGKSEKSDVPIASSERGDSEKAGTVPSWNSEA